MNLAKHISQLLKYHECVIIPDFGGFISNYKPTQFNAVKNTFIPPSKEVVFNAQIKKNDGLLINHISESENISYSQAESVVIKFVDRIFESLNKGEHFEIESLGKFETNKSGAVLFSASCSFNHLDTYGLTEVAYATINETKPVFNSTPAIGAIHRRKDIVKIAASIAIVVALSFIPTGNKNEILQGSVISNVLNTSPTVVKNEVTEKPEQSEITKTVIEQERKLEVSSQKPYIVVGGSFKNRINATNYQNSLIEKGYNSEIMILKSGLYRVVIDSYKSQYDAETAMIDFNSNNSKSNAWVGKR